MDKNKGLDKTLEILLNRLTKEVSERQSKIEQISHYQQLLQQYQRERPELADKVYVGREDNPEDDLQLKLILANSDLSLAREVRLDIQENGFFDCLGGSATGEVGYRLLFVCDYVNNQEEKINFIYLEAGNIPRIRGVKITERSCEYNPKISTLEIPESFNYIAWGCEDKKIRLPPRNKFDGYNEWFIRFGEELTAQQIENECYKRRIPEGLIPECISAIIEEQKNNTRGHKTEETIARYKEQGLREEVVPQLREALAIAYEKTNGQLYARIRELGVQKQNRKR